MNYYLKPLPEDDGILSMEYEMLPRWKESELSGDEWRYTRILTVVRRNPNKTFLNHNTNNRTVREYRDLDIVSILGKFIAENHRPYFGLVEKFGDITLCFQPRCMNEPTVLYRIKQEWTTHSERGHKMVRDYGIPVRAFCGDHRHRGDCDLEDADDNYELLAADVATYPVSPSTTSD